MLLAVAFALLSPLPQDQHPEQRGGGLHGYIAFSATQPPDRAEYGFGCGFYSAVWQLIDEPLALAEEKTDRLRRIYANAQRDKVTAVWLKILR